MLRMLFVISLCFFGSTFLIAHSGVVTDSLKKIECEKNAGRWVTPPSQILNTGMDLSYCVLPSQDAGNACESSQQCNSVCSTQEAVTKGQEVSGECFEWSSPVGHCLMTVENGVATGEICFD